MTIEISHVSGTELYNRYPGQSEPQDCYVELDARGDGALSCESNLEIGNAVPMAVWYRHVLRFALSNPLRADAANALLAEIAPLAERVVAGYSSTFDGSNHVAEYDVDAEAAIEEIERLCERSGGDGEDLVVWRAEDWFAPIERGGDKEARRASVGRELGITARTSNARLRVIEREILADAVGSDVDAIEDLDDYLESVRAALRAIATERAQSTACA